MASLRELGIAISRIVLGMVLLLEGLIVLDLIIHLSNTSSTFSGRIAAAYDDSYDKGYHQTYETGYQGAYDEAYDKGYYKGYEIGLETDSKEGVSRRAEFINPTYKELQEFLTRDKTDSNPYIKDEYGCFEFAAELNNNAEANGIRAGYVSIRSKNWWHAAVAFETIDRGLIFIEPQSDMEIKLVVGELYPWRSVGAVIPTNYTDAVDEIIIMW